MQLALYLEHGEQFARAAQKLPPFTTVDIDSILLDCGLEVLPVAASHFLGPDHLPGIEFPYPEIRVVFRLKDRPMVSAIYNIDVFVTDATLSLVNRALGHQHVEVNRRYAQIERYISNKENGLLELVGCSHKALIDRLTQAFLDLRTAYLSALEEQGCLPVPRHTP
ncbi:MAG TPA: hypothetical protein VJ550_08705 [Geomonas sp.]|nr:hypothetical protein [Geomonas sp.]